MAKKYPPSPGWLRRAGKTCEMVKKYKTIRHRLLKIDEILRRHSGRNAARLPNCVDIAAELEVSSKTIQRDMNHLRDIEKAPIEFDKERNGYYYTEENELETRVIRTGQEQNTRDIFMRCYRCRTHGCRDERPEYWREYR